MFFGRIHEASFWKIKIFIYVPFPLKIFFVNRQSFDGVSAEKSVAFARKRFVPKALVNSPIVQQTTKNILFTNLKVHLNRSRSKTSAKLIRI